MFDLTLQKQHQYNQKSVSSVGNIAYTSSLNSVISLDRTSFNLP